MGFRVMTDDSRSYDLLARLDERTKAIQSEISHLRTEVKEKVERIESSITTMKREVDDVLETVEKDYVRKETFVPIQKIVYGVVGLILTAVFAAIIGMVIIK